MLVQNIRKNGLGTINFEAQFRGMNKPEMFIAHYEVKPMAKGGFRMTMQSRNHVAIIDSKGNVILGRGEDYTLFVVRGTDKVENVRELAQELSGALAEAISKGLVS